MKTSEAVSGYLVECEARGLAESTIEQYRWALGRMVANCGGIPRTGKRLLVAWGGSSLSLESRKDLRKCWRTFFKWYGRQAWPVDQVPANPIEELGALPSKRKIPRVLSRQEVCKLLSVAEQDRDRIMVLLNQSQGETRIWVG